MQAFGRLGKLGEPVTVRVAEFGQGGHDNGQHNATRGT